MSDFPSVFERLKTALQKYNPPLAARVDEDGRYELWSEKDLVIEGRKRKEVFFASAIIQKNFVGFYYMPVYVDTEMKSLFSPRMLKLLKGKSCFHVKQMDDTLLADIEEALAAGFELYRRRGWVEEAAA